MVSGPLAAVYLDASAELSRQAADEARALPPKVAGLVEEEETAQARKHLSWLKSITAALIERARALRNRHRMQNVLALSSAQGPLSITSDQWDTDPWLLGTPDGVIDLRAGQLHPGRPEEYIRTIIPTSYQGIEARARAGKLYERYKAWASENSLRVLNGKAFGMEMKKRFTWLQDKRGAYYQGVGILISDEESEGLFGSENGGGSNSESNTPVNALVERDHPLKISSAGGGSGGTFHNLTKVGNQPYIGESFGITHHCHHQQSLEKPIQPTSEASGGTKLPGNMTHHQQSLEKRPDETSQVSDFPFPRERQYVRTITGLVGYLSRKDSGGRRGVCTLFDGQESAWRPPSLYALTREEARAWWLENVTREEAQASNKLYNP